jgi:hypothetical protein
MEALLDFPRHHAHVRIDCAVADLDQEHDSNSAPRFSMRWQTERDYERVLARYNRRRRSFYRSLYRRAAKAAGIVVIAALLLFGLRRYLGI